MAFGNQRKACRVLISGQTNKRSLPCEYALKVHRVSMRQQPTQTFGNDSPWASNGTVSSTSPAVIVGSVEATSLDQLAPCFRTCLSARNSLAGAPSCNDLARAVAALDQYYDPRPQRCS